MFLTMTRSSLDWAGRFFALKSYLETDVGGQIPSHTNGGGVGGGAPALGGRPLRERRGQLGPMAMTLAKNHPQWAKEFTEGRWKKEEGKWRLGVRPGPEV